MHGTIETRIGILEVARVQFMSYGFSKVTMDEIAREVGVSKKTLYANFTSKYELADEVLKRQLLSGLRRYKDIVNSPDAYVLKFYHILELLGDTMARMSFQFQTDLRRLRPLLWKRVEHIRSETLVASFARFAAEGETLGLVRTDIHKQLFLLAYLNALQETTRSEVLMSHSFSSNEAIKTIVDVMIQGILTDAGRRELEQQFTTPSSTRTNV